MKKFIIENGTTMDSNDPGVLGVIYVALSEAIKDIPDLSNWKFIFEDIRDDDDDPFFRASFIALDGCSEETTTERMIDRLKMYPEINNTGEICDRELLEAGCAAQYGGVRVPYQAYTQTEPSNHVAVSGSIHIAFSGANEAVNLGIVMDVLYRYIEYCVFNANELGLIFDTQSLLRDQLVFYMANTNPFWF